MTQATLTATSRKFNAFLKSRTGIRGYVPTKAKYQPMSRKASAWVPPTQDEYDEEE